IAISCGIDYMLGRSCAAKHNAQLPDKLAALRPQVDLVMAGVRSVLAQAGQADARIALQSYPNPVATVNQYSGRLNRLAHGCPFGDEDAAWARYVLAPAIATVMREAAQSAAVEYLDLTAAMDGRQACSPGGSPQWTNGVKLQL